MRREGRKGRREGSSPKVIPQGQTQSLGEKTELCPVKEEERENCLDWAPTVYWPTPKLCQSHPSPKEQRLWYLSHEGATQSGHNLTPSPDGLPRPCGPAPSLPASQSNSERKEGRGRLIENWSPREERRPTVRVGREALNQLVSAQGKAITILGPWGWEGGAHNPGCTFSHPWDWARDQKMGKPGPTGAETRLRELETSEYDVNHQQNSRMNQINSFIHALSQQICTECV